MRPDPVEPLGIWHNADAHNHKIGFDERTIGQLDAVHRAVSEKSLATDAEAQVDAMVAMHVGQHRAHRRPKGPFERSSGHLDHRDVNAKLTGYGCHLSPDESCSDHNHPLRTVLKT